MIYLIIAYIIFLIVYGVFSYIILFHLNKFGYRENANRLMAIAYVVISLTIIVLTFVILIANGVSFNSDFVSP